MSERSFVGGLEWAPSSGGSAQGMESWEAASQDRVYLSVDGPRDRSYDGEWTWQAQHRANGWCKLNGTAATRQEAMKTAAKAVSYIDDGVALKSDKSAREFPEVWRKWLGENPDQVRSPEE